MPVSWDSAVPRILFLPGVRVFTAPSPSSTSVICWCQIPFAASVHRKSLGTEPPFMVVRALVFAIGTVTRIDLLADHFTVRLRRRGFLPLAVIVDARGRRYYLPFAASADGICPTGPTSPTGPTNLVLGGAPLAMSVCEQKTFRDRFCVTANRRLQTNFSSN